jgi:predicted molibdopterin-dependent oxidoreductase YjgC
MTEPTTQTITASIDDREVRVAAGSTILQAAVTAGMYIPTLCSLECLPAYGGCRLCIVEVENMRGFPTACTTPISQGMKISTHTEKLQTLRREILELILSEHPYSCLVCKDKKDCVEFMHTTRKVNTTTGCNFCTNNGGCELQDLVDYLDLKEIRFPIVYRNLPPVKDNPFYDLDYNLCILCGRCVRICNEERYSEVLSFVHRGNAALVGTAFAETQKEAGCEYCGACVDVCPTGALSEKMGSWVGQPDKSTGTYCVFCGITCKITVNSKGNRIVNVGPKPGTRDNPPQVCLRGKFIPGDITHHPQRVTRPHIRKKGKWAEATWEEAISAISENLIQYRGDRFGLIGSAHDTIENSLVLQQFARQTMQSANVDISPAYGYKTLVRDIHDYSIAHGHVEVDDILGADTIYVIGAQAHWSHPIIENRIRKAYKAGKEVIVANTTAHRTVNFSTDFRQYAKGREHIFLHRLMQELTAGKEGKSTVMLIGDEVLQSDRAEENFQRLMRIVELSGNSVKMLFLLPEGNRYGATMAGMNPVSLPGFADAGKEGLTVEEMLKKQKVISALYLVGDISHARSLKSLKGLKFFVQQNMFFSPASEYAQVFLPLENSMESDGHIVNLEGKPIHLTPVIGRNDHILPTSRVVGRIAAALNGRESFDTSPESIAGEIQALIAGSLAKGRKVKSSDANPDPKSRSKNSMLTREMLKKYHFHYMGNNLADRIPDLREVLEE